MSEPDTPNQIFDLANTTEAEVNGSPGKLLRAAREAAGIHIAALAGALKIPTSKLEALENDDFATLPDAVFARALACSICRTLNLEPEIVLKLMPKNEIFSFSSVDNGINTSFKDSSYKVGRNHFIEYIKRPIGLAVIFLLIGILIILFVPFGNQSPVISDKTVRNESSTIELQNFFPPKLVEPVVSELATGSSDSVAAEVVVHSAAIPIPVAIGATLGTEPTAPLLLVKPEAQAPASPAELLQFRALGESWVQVRDATKNVVFERTLSKGQTASTTGILPLTVVIGRADMTEVLVRGKIFELSDVAKENVARFEVKQ